MAALRGGNRPELASTNCKVALSPVHASAPAFFAAWTRLDSSMTEWASSAATILALDVDTPALGTGWSNDADC